MRSLKGQSQISYCIGSLEKWLLATPKFNYSIRFTVHQVMPSFRLLYAHYGIPTLYVVKSNVTIKFRALLDDIENEEILLMHKWLTK